MKRGKKLRLSVAKNVFTIIKEIKLVTPETIRRNYNAKYNEKIGWATIRRYLDLLIEEEYVTEEVLTKGKKRTIALYKVNNTKYKTQIRSKEINNDV